MPQCCACLAVVWTARSQRALYLLRRRIRLTPFPSSALARCVGTGPGYAQLTHIFVREAVAYRCVQNDLAKADCAAAQGTLQFSSFSYCVSILALQKYRRVPPVHPA